MKFVITKYHGDVVDVKLEYKTKKKIEMILWMGVVIPIISAATVYFVHIQPKTNQKQ